MTAATLVGSELAAASLACFLMLHDVLAVGSGSRGCRVLCCEVLRFLHLRAFGCNDAASRLLSLARSSLTEGGAAIRELNAAFARSFGTAVLQALPKLPSLRSLNLDMCQDVDDEGLAAVAQRCPALRHFSLYWNAKVTDRGIGRVLRAQQGKELLSLCLSGCKQLSDDTMARVAAAGPRLEVLDLTRCPQLSDAGVRLVMECLDRLRVLRLYAMGQLSAAAFTPLPRLLLLEDLDFCGCRIEDGPLVGLLEAAAPCRLHTLNLTWCSALTDATAMLVAEKCSRLTWLSYFGNTNITSAAVEALAASACGPRLRALDIRGLTKASQYSSDSNRLRRMFPAVQQTELHH